MEEKNKGVDSKKLSGMQKLFVFLVATFPFSGSIIGITARELFRRANPEIAAREDAEAEFQRFVYEAERNGEGDHRDKIYDVKSLQNILIKINKEAETFNYDTTKGADARLWYPEKSSTVSTTFRVGAGSLNLKIVLSNSGRVLGAVYKDDSGKNNFDTISFLQTKFTEAGPAGKELFNNVLKHVGITSQEKVDALAEYRLANQARDNANVDRKWQGMAEGQQPDQRIR